MNATATIPQTATVDRMQSFRMWMAGFDAYAANQPYDETASVNWRQGWRDARAGEAECHRLDARAHVEKQVHVLTEEECVAETADYHDWLEFMSDIDWSQRGAW